jgi:hypothetical protein
VRGLQPSGVYLSGKVTHSVYHFIIRNTSDIEGLYELTEIPTQLLKDPTSWINARDVETFLEAVDKKYSFLSPERPLMTTIGHSCSDLRAWGALDSVLKMMQDPQDVFGHPQRFLSYFISPAPPIANVKRGSDSVGFDLPLSPEESPFFTEFLVASFEGMPQYSGKQLAQVTWENTRIEINWSAAQEALFSASSSQVNIKPELIRSLIQYLEEAQTQIEEKKRELLAKDQQIERLMQSQLAATRGMSDEQQVVLENVRSQFYRLFDYMGRASQLVTLLVRQDRKDRQVQEAMKRVDWDAITHQLPEIKMQILDQVENLATPLPPHAVNELTSSPSQHSLPSQIQS